MSRDSELSGSSDLILSRLKRKLDQVSLTLAAWIVLQLRDTTPPKDTITQQLIDAWQGSP